MDLFIICLWLALGILPLSFALAIAILLCRSAWVRFTPYAGPTYAMSDAAARRNRKAKR